MFSDQKEDELYHARDDHLSSLLLVASVAFAQEKRMSTEKSNVYNHVAVHKW